MSPAPLDMRRLKKDVAIASSTRAPALAPGGKPVTGLMESVRKNLDDILVVKASASWNVIAAQVTAQGFRTADGKAITGNNLSGIVSSVKRQRARRAQQEAKRAGRGDLGPGRPARGPKQVLNVPLGHSRLAPELRARRAEAAADETGPISEDDVRRMQADNHKSRFGKGQG